MLLLQLKLKKKKGGVGGERVPTPTLRGCEFFHQRTLVLEVQEVQEQGHGVRIS